MKIVVDRLRCSSIGVCESIAPHYFEIAEDGSLILIREIFDDADRALIEEAVRSCPARALSIREEK